MRKFPVLTSIRGKTIKRSITMQQLEILFLIGTNPIIDLHRNYFNLSLGFFDGEINKSILIKRIPNGYLKKFEVK